MKGFQHGHLKVAGSLADDFKLVLVLGDADVGDGDGATLTGDAVGGKPLTPFRRRTAVVEILARGELNGDAKKCVHAIFDSSHFRKISLEQPESGNRLVTRVRQSQLKKTSRSR